MIAEKLQKFGLSDKEARVCGALFELGDTVVTNVAKRADINRSTAYVLLESLGKKGLVSISERRGVRVYSPVSTDRLITIAESSVKKSKELLDLSKELASELKESSGSISVKSAVKVYEGSEGYKIVSEDKLNANELIRSYASVADIHAAYPKHVSKYKGHSSGKHRVQTILPDSLENRRILGTGTSNKNESYLVQGEGYTGELNIYANKVSFTSPVENTSIIFESPQFAKALKTLFDLAISKARRFNIRQAEKGSAHREKEMSLVKAEQRFFEGK